jgi:hypothetical protein
MPLNKLVIIILFSLTTTAYGLTEIPAGKIEIEGKVLIENGKTYLVMNPETYSQTKLLLKGDSSAFKDQNDSNARVLVKLDKKIMAASGEVALIKLVRFLHPAEDLKAYNQTDDFKK